MDHRWAAATAAAAAVAGGYIWDQRRQYVSRLDAPAVPECHHRRTDPRREPLQPDLDARVAQLKRLPFL